MTTDQTRLTPLEEAQALTRAGIDTDYSTWDDATLERASEVLDAAQADKMLKLYPKSTEMQIRAREAQYRLKGTIQHG